MSENKNDLIRRKDVKDIMFDSKGVRIYTHNGEKLKRSAKIDLDEFDAIPSEELDIRNDGTLHISVGKGQLDKIGRVLVTEDGTTFCKLFY